MGTMAMRRDAMLAVTTSLARLQVRLPCPPCPARLVRPHSSSTPECPSSLLLLLRVC